MCISSGPINCHTRLWLTDSTEPEWALKCVWTDHPPHSLRNLDHIACATHPPTHPSGPWIMLKLLDFCGSWNLKCKPYHTIPYHYPIGMSVQRLLNWHELSALTQLAQGFDAYLIGTSVWHLPNWHEHLTLTQLAQAFNTYPIGTSVRHLPKLAQAFNAYLIGTRIWRLLNWHKHSTLNLLAQVFNAYQNLHERSTFA